MTRRDDLMLCDDGKEQYDEQKWICSISNSCGGEQFRNWARIGNKREFGTTYPIQ